MKIDPGRFVVQKGAKVRLDDWPTAVKPYYDSKEHFAELMARHLDALRDLQERLYADNRYALLVIFQGMDAAGKDGVIRHVMSGVNPQGVQVFSFKHPSPTELDHDFLWREVACLPERGRIGIFNRSHYEEVLIVRVHPDILKSQALPEEALDHVWDHRYESIVDFERHLHRNGTRVLKFFLHLSKGEQRRRFLARIDDPQKNWKFSFGDIEERKRWKDYMRAYEACFRATSRKSAPWFVVPADDKKNARLIVGQAIIDALRAMKLEYPEVSAAQRRQLQTLRRKLAGRTV